MNTIVKKTTDSSDSFLCILMKMLLSHRFESKRVKRLNREKSFHLRSFDWNQNGKNIQYFRLKERIIVMIVNATRMLQAAKKGHYAVGHFNTNYFILEWTCILKLLEHNCWAKVCKHLHSTAKTKKSLFRAKFWSKIIPLWTTNSTNIGI